MKNVHKKAIAIHVTCLSSVLDLGYLLDKNLPINIKNTTIPTGTPTIGVANALTPTAATIPPKVLNMMGMINIMIAWGIPAFQRSNTIMTTKNTMRKGIVCPLN
ncbi:Uncharacterised protein [Enterobacter hormaechei]|nr:Uncharacterised protein [Enterobacter hormaechei]